MQSWSPGPSPDAGSLRVPRSSLKKSWTGEKRGDTASAETVQAWIIAFRGSNAYGPANVFEEASLTKLLLQTVYKRPLEETEAVAVLEACQEIFWLVECHSRTPLPPGWRKSKVAEGDVPLYANESTGAVTETPPTFRYFGRLAETCAHACYNPEMASQVVALVHEVLAEIRLSAADLKTKWTGPHIDPETQEPFFHSPSTGVSSYEDPSAWATFLKTVAEHLLQHLQQLATQRVEYAKQQQQEAAEAKPVEESHGGVKAADSSGPFALGLSLADRVKSSSAKEEAVAPKAASPKKHDPWAALEDLDSMVDKSILHNESKDAWAAMEDLIDSQNKKLPSLSQSSTCPPPPKAKPVNAAAAAPPQPSSKAPVVEAGAPRGECGQPHQHVVETSVVKQTTVDSQKQAAPGSSSPSQKLAEDTTLACNGPATEPQAGKEVENLRTKVSSLEQQVSELTSERSKVSALEEQLSELKKQLQSASTTATIATSHAPQEQAAPAKTAPQPAPPAPQAKLPSKLASMPGVSSASEAVAQESKASAAVDGGYSHNAPPVPHAQQLDHLPTEAAVAAGYGQSAPPAPVALPSAAALIKDAASVSPIRSDPPAPVGFPSMAARVQHAAVASAVPPVAPAPTEAAAPPQDIQVAAVSGVDQEVEDADDMDAWAADTNVSAGRKKKAVPEPPAAPEPPVRKALEGDIADDLPGWAADVDASAATDAGMAGAGFVRKSADKVDAAIPKELPDLQTLVARLKNLPVQESAHKWDRTAICDVLEALEQIPLTVDDLRETKLGVLTQPYKDSPDAKVRTVARRLRKAWKSAVAG